VKYNPYSFSKVSLYNNCNRKFKYKYIDRIKVKTDTYHLEKGNYVHEVLEHLRTGGEVDVSKYNLTAEQIAEIDVLIDTFVQSEFSKTFLYPKTDHVFTEIKFGIDTKLEVSDYDYRDKNLLYLGAVDQVNFYSDSLHVIDWKTGKVRNYTEQLRHYAMWALTQFPNVEKVITSYVFIEHNQSIDVIVTREELKKIHLELLSNIQTIETDEQFFRKETPLCDYCEYGHHHSNICE
jgi:CRISPR/Cas system-associated exonuclease Cas4 (RecB family)